MHFKQIWSRLNATIVLVCLSAITCPSLAVLAASAPSKIVIAHAGMSAVEASVDIQMGRFDDWPNATERVIGNVMRFYLEFQGTPLATIDQKEIREARDAYLARKRSRG